MKMEQFIYDLRNGYIYENVRRCVPLSSSRLPSATGHHNPSMRACLPDWVVHLSLSI